MAQTLHKGDFTYFQQCLLVSRKHTAVLQNFSGKSQVVPGPFSNINHNEAALSGLLNRDTHPSHCGKAPKRTFLLILLAVQKKSDFSFLFFSSCGVCTNYSLIQMLVLVASLLFFFLMSFHLHALLPVYVGNKQDQVC